MRDLAQSRAVDADRPDVPVAVLGLRVEGDRAVRPATSAGDPWQRPGPRVSRVGFDPSASASQISARSPARSDSKAIRRPSGEYCGSIRERRLDERGRRAAQLEAVDVGVARTCGRTRDGRGSPRWTGRRRRGRPAPRAQEERRRPRARARDGRPARRRRSSARHASRPRRGSTDRCRVRRPSRSPRPQLGIEGQDVHVADRQPSAPSQEA